MPSVGAAPAGLARVEGGLRRQACLSCSRRKVACRWATSTVCDQCMHRGTECIQPRADLSRRQREILEKAIKKQIKGVHAAGGTLRDALVALSVASVSATASSNSRPPKPDAPVVDNPPVEIVFPSLAAVWTFAGEWLPLVHRIIFENAFLVGQCAIYGSPPVSLLHALVSLGVRLAPDITATPTQRAAWATWHLERAHDLLSSGHLSAKKGKTMSDLEAVQTIIIILFSSIATGVGARYLQLLEKGAEIAKAACMTGPLPASQGTFPLPTNYIEWVHDEMRMRTWVGFGLFDAIYGYFAGRQPYNDYVTQPFRLPVYDHYFNSMEPDVAFSLFLVEHGPASLVKLADLGSLLSITDPNARSKLIRELIAPIFGRTRSLHGLSALFGMLRIFRIRIREFATKHGIDPFVLAGKLADDEQESQMEPAEAEYLEMTLRMEDIVSCFKDALPAEVAAALLSDDVKQVFQRATVYFGDIRRTHWFFQTCSSFPDILLENWVDEDLITTAAFRSADKGGPSGAKAMLRFLASPIFQGLAENAIWSTRMMEGQLAEDPQLLYWHVSTTLGKVRVAAFWLAAWKMHSTALAMDSLEKVDPIRLEMMASLERDVKVAAAWVFAVGKRFRPFGLQFARILAKLMLAAGMVSLPDGSAVEGILTFDEEIETVQLKREVQETDDDV